MSGEHHEENTDKRNVTRRNALNVIATVGSVGLSTGLGSAVATAEKGLQVERLSGRRAIRAVVKALQDEDVKTIKRHLVEKGFVPQIDDARASLTTVDGGQDDYYSVILPFETDSNSDQVFIGWVENEAMATAGHWIRPSDSDDWVETTYTVESGSITTSTQTLPDSLRSQGDGEYSVQHHFPCSPGKSVNWDCVKEVATQYSLIVGACGTCAKTQDVFACATCVGVVAREYEIECTLCT